nr:MAG TPA: hypothetical protein [Caudoviricetes sp.]
MYFNYFCTMQTMFFLISSLLSHLHLLMYFIHFARFTPLKCFFLFRLCVVSFLSHCRRITDASEIRTPA